MTLHELREKRNKLVYDARQLVDAGDTISAESKATIDKLTAEARSLGDLIRATEESEADERAMSEARNTVPASQRGAVTAAVVDKDEAWRRYAVTGEVREQSLTAGEGGYTVAPDVSFYGRVISAMKLYGGVEAAPVTVLNTATGADLPIATDDDTANVGTLVAEAGSHASGTAVVLGATTLKAYMLSSKIVKVSRQLLQDSAINWETFLANKFAIRLARGRNAYLTTGTGSAQPQGVAYAASTGRTCASGYTTSCTADDLKRLFHAVNPVYRNPATSRWMMNDASALIIGLLKDGDGQYIWKAGLSEDRPDMLLGRGVIINPDMADMAASAKSVLFGDFSNYYVRNVSGLEVIRLNELYAVNGQVGFLALQRFDGALVDAGQHPIQALVNAAS